MIGAAYLNHCELVFDDVRIPNDAISAYNQRKGLEDYVNKIADEHC